LLEINVGTRDTAADEMLTKKNGAKNPFFKISGTIASHWLIINKFGKNS
jgi:hypothetical protein